MKTLEEAVKEMKKMSNADLLLRWQAYFNEYNWMSETQRDFENEMWEELLKRMEGK